MKTVSIIIPVYNAEAYICQCFENVSKQTYEHSAIECIFIDDGSTDQSLSKIKETIKRYNGGICFRCVPHIKNQGVSAARNTGIKEANNEYLLFIDVDDTLSPDCIELLIESKENHPKADVIVGNVLNMKEDTCHHSPFEITIRQGKITNLHDTLLFIFTSYPVNKLILRSFILDNDLFFPIGIPYFEDMHWNIDLAKASNEIVYIPQRTYFYEYVMSSAMSTSNKREQTVANCYVKLIEKALSLNIPECWVETHLFIHFYIKKILSIKNINQATLRATKQFRRNLLKESINHKKPLMFLYNIQLFQPFRAISTLHPIESRSAKLRLWICKNS